MTSKRAGVGETSGGAPKQPEKTYDCVVVGGGIAGLYAAWKLLRESPGKRILVLEKSDRRLGGRLWSEEFGDRWVALGGGVPRARDARLAQLAIDLQLTPQFWPPSDRVFVWDPTSGRVVDRKKEISEIVRLLKEYADVHRAELESTPLTFLQLLDRAISPLQREKALAWWGYRDADDEDALSVVDRYGLEDVEGTASYGTFGPKGYQTLVDALVTSLESRPNFRAVLGARVDRAGKSRDARFPVSVSWISVDGSRSEVLAKVVLWCTDARGLKEVRLEPREEDDRLRELTSAVQGVPFSRLYARFDRKEDAVPEAFGKGMVRAGGLVGNVYSDGKSDVAMASYVGGSESDRWNGLVDNVASDRPIRVRPGDETWKRLSGMLERELGAVFGKQRRVPAELLLIHWPDGVHLWRIDGKLPGGRLSADREFRCRSRTFLNGRFRVAGEAVAAGHGWVEDALESVDEILDKVA